MKSDKFHDIVEQLSTRDSYQSVFRPARAGIHMPSIDILQDIVTFLRRICFPGFFAHSEVTVDTMSYYIGANLDNSPVCLRRREDQIT